MKKRMKKFTAALLSTLMIFTMFPATQAFAANKNITIAVSPTETGTVTVTGYNFFGSVIGNYSVTGSKSLTLNNSSLCEWDIEAAPNSGYTFSGWSVSGSVSVDDSTSSSTYINSGFGNNAVVTANFSRQYTLTASCSPSSGGTITGNSGTYSSGSTATITAVPAGGYVFDHWTGDSTSTSSTISLTMNSNKSVQAVFAQAYTLTAYVTPSSGGTVSGTGKHKIGSTATVTASANSGYRFDGWSGVDSQNGTTAYVTMNENKSVTATFVKTYTLTANASPSGGGTVTGANTYDSGSVATLTAVPNSGYRFVSWSGVSSSSGTTAYVNMTSDKTVTATFQAVKTLTVNKPAFLEADSNNGTIGNGPITITLANDTFRATTYFNSAYSITGVPSGLTPTLTRTGDNTASLSFSGTAINNNASDSTNITVTFKSSAFTSLSTPDSGNPVVIPLTFYDNPSVSFSGSGFNESALNNGSIDTGSKITAELTGNITFKSGSFTSSDFTVTNLPGGLSVSAVRTDDKHLSISLSGTAANHAKSNSVSNTTISFNSSAFSGYTGVVEGNLETFSVNFNDPAKISVDESALTESDANDGSIAGGKNLLLTNAKFADAEFIQGTHYTVSGLPSGLTAVLTRKTDTRLELSIEGNAVNHTSANNASITLTLLDPAFNGVSAGSVPGASKQFSIKFLDNKPIRVLEVYPSALTSTTDGNFKDAATQLTNSKYIVTSMTMNRFVSAIDDVNGNYDVVYFGRGRYLKAGTNDANYGNDITQKAANKVLEFINTGGVCILHSDAFSSVSPATLMENNFDNINVLARSNVKTVSGTSFDLSSLIQSTLTASNKRPVMDMVQCPSSYRAVSTPYDSNLVEVTFRASDAESAQLRAVLYIDKNNDGLFSTQEAVDTHTVNNGKFDTFIYRMPTGLTGVYFWKVELSDANGLQDEYNDVFRLLGDEVTINVLQVYPDSGNTGDLSTLLKKTIPSDPSRVYGELPGEYKINVTKVSAAEFNNPPANDTKHLNDLNGNYNMIIFGFEDEYGREDLDSDACDRLDSFIATGQSVMFTHDTIEYVGYRASNLLTRFRDDVGQTSQITAGQVVRDNSSGTVSTNFGLNNSATANLYTRLVPSYTVTQVYQTNSTALTLYPFNLENVPQNLKQVADTHYQYYKLDLEDPDVIPVYNLYRSDISQRLLDDSMNNYYTYTKGNITYSGTGHTSTTGGYPDFELQLFVNTMLKAYSAANHAPTLEIYKPVNNENLDVKSSTVPLSFRGYDYDFGDETLYYKVYIDRNNTGAYEQVGSEASMASGDTINMSVDKLFSDARIFKIKVELRDSHNAIAVTELTLNNTEVPTLTPTIATDKDVYLVGDSINVTVGINPSGKVSPNQTITPSLSLDIPAGIDSQSSRSVNYNVNSFEFGSNGPLTSAYTASTKLAASNNSGTGSSSYTLKSSCAYSLNGNSQTQTATKGITIRSGSTQVYVKDSQNNPMKEVSILDNGSLTGKETGSGGRYLFDAVGRGSHCYGIEIPSGYILDSVIIKPNGGASATYKDPNDAVVSMNTTNYQWEVTFVLKLDITINVSYYKMQPNKTYTLISPDAKGEYKLPVAKNSKVRVVAMFQIPTIESTDVQTVQLTLKTLQADGTGSTFTQNAAGAYVSTSGTVIPDFNAYSPKPGTILSADEAKGLPHNPDNPEFMQLFNQNTQSGFTYAGDNWYYTVIEVDKANNQQFTIDSIKLVMDTGSAYVLTDNDVKIINLVDLSPPKLK